MEERVDRFPYTDDGENLDRATCLQTVLAHCQEFLFDHHDVGLNLQATLPRMTELALDPHHSRLVCHAPSANCRVTLYLDSIREGRTLIPTGINAVMGTCKDARRRGLCAHTLAGIKQFQAALQNRSHRLREQLFPLGQSEAWRSAISLLDQFAAAAPTAAPRSAQPDSRVIWRVTYSGPETDSSGGGAVRLNVHPYQQTLKASGKGWSRGKRLAIETFSRLDEANLHPADRRLQVAVHKKFTTDYYYYGGGGFDPVELLGHLIGHPLVVWDDSQRAIEVVEGEFGLLVREQPEGWRILASIDGLPPESKLI
jgi:hypothetical protein